ncbi:MAG: DUF2281 domain-containing protein [Sphingobacteriaceae bacterium]|nr:MAG: DUF2281 domain-containing protein [Sphingobacteriaceae bacterium]
METTSLLEKVERLPEPLKKEVEDFVDFLIYKNGELKTPISKPSKKSGFGSGKGLFGKISDDFDAPLDEMKQYS